MKLPYIRKRLTQTLLIGLLIITASACGEVFDVSVSPEGECWNIQENVSLTTSVSSATVRPELLFNFDQDYPFTNLQLKMICTAPSGEANEYEFQTTVLSATGDWLLPTADGGYQVIIALADEFITSESGEYTFSLMHNMRDDQICGVRKIGIRLPK